MSSNFLFDHDTVPTTLKKGAIAIVNGVMYVGNDDNEPYPAKGYKEYKAILNQSGTNAPVATVLVNDLSITPTYSYDSEGSFAGSFPSLLTENKVDINISRGGGANAEDVFDAYRDTVSIVGISSFSNGAPANGIILDCVLTIKIYP